VVTPRLRERLNHALFVRKATPVCDETVLGYDAVEQKLRQEGHHGHYSTADPSEFITIYGMLCLQ
jgi:hypothetical protein